MRSRFACWPSFALLGLTMAFPAATLAQSSPSASPTPALPAGIFMTSQDAALSAGAGKAITFPIDVLNNTPKLERIKLAVSSAPANWDPMFQDGSNNVTELELLPGKDSSITFQVTPPADAQHATQQMSLKGTTDDGLSAAVNLSVEITSQTSTGLDLTTSYPNISGSAGAKFEYSFTIANNTGKDNTFGLSANSPSNDWQIYFQPSAGTSTITSTAVKSGSTQTVNLEVQSPPNVKPADYPINVTVSDNAGHDASAALKVTITGDYKIDLNTSTQQFSGTANPGQPETVTFLVSNLGNVDLSNVSMTAANAPNGWNVSFQPSSIDTIAPGASSQVQAKIVPAANASAGDYVLNFTSANDKANVNKDFRVTVQTANIVAWVIGIIVAVIVVGGLIWLFQGYRRT